VNNESFVLFLSKYREPEYRAADNRESDNWKLVRNSAVRILDRIELHDHVTSIYKNEIGKR